ncbi:autotransporter outer membrane beta-barrel domain-containing protein [Chryseobacterium daeguense]|uniref:hypothetical protein n=1 Tax=Chryseobacterium daeguense TaxID=412438 RepID=UPI000411FEED|nr:hypothetical protein [Chryseobacterium daeguense]
MKTTIVLAVLLPAVYYSQVGVNTSNPQAAFHVDGGKDNAVSGVPTTLQQSNDLAVSNLGRVGIGITNPAARLHLYNHAAASDIDDDYLFDDESPIGNGHELILRRSNVGANLSNNNVIGSVLFNAKINNNFSYSGAGIMGIHRGNGTVQNNALAFLINSSREAGRFDEFGNLGIDVTAPKNLLHLGGAVGSSVTDVAGKKLAVFNNSTGDDFYGLGLSSGFLQFHASSTPAEAPGMVLTSGGRVGINLGTTAPAANLDVAGNIKITDGTQGAGKILVSDANGLASWQNASTASTNIYNADGSLTGNRTVTQAGHPITFTGGDLNVVPASSGSGLTITRSSNNPITNSPRIFSPTALELQSNNNQGVMVLNGNDSVANTDPVFRVAFGNLNHTPGYTEYLRVQGNGSVGIGNTTPNAQASLDLGATNKAFITNRVTGPSAISSPSDGMIIFDTTGKCFKGYGNGAWQDLSVCVNAPLLIDANKFPLAVMVNSNNYVSATGFIRVTGGTGTISPALTTVSSSGVIGLNLVAMNNNYDPRNGMLYFNISGYPSSHNGSSAIFNFSINGVPHTWVISVF